MGSDPVTSNHDGPEVVDRWTAPRLRWIVLLYIVLVFAVFMAISYFVLDSAAGVKALLLALLASVAATVPGILEKIEYRMTASGIEKRPLKKAAASEFMSAFRWDELSRVVPMRHGFKYFKKLDEKNALRRFWKLHFCDQYSGEVHVEHGDLARVLGHVEGHGFPTS